MVVEGLLLALGQGELDGRGVLEGMVEGQELLAQGVKVFVQGLSGAFVKDVDPFGFLVQVVEEEAVPRKSLYIFLLIQGHVHRLHRALDMQENCCKSGIKEKPPNLSGGRFPFFSATCSDSRQHAHYIAKIGFILFSNKYYAKFKSNPVTSLRISATISFSTPSRRASN